jgi:hypothetical protein
MAYIFINNIITLKINYNVGTHSGHGCEVYEGNVKNYFEESRRNKKIRSNAGSVIKLTNLY